MSGSEGSLYARMQVDHLPEKSQGRLLIAQLLGRRQRSERPGVGVVEFACQGVVCGHCGELGNDTCGGRAGVCGQPCLTGSSEVCVHLSPFVRGKQ